MDASVSHTFRRTTDGQGLFYGWFEAMHSRFDVLLVGPEEATALSLCGEVARETQRLEGRLSRFDERSEVRRLNDNTYYERCHTDPEMLGIFDDALRYHSLTLGAFDICIQTPGYDPQAEYFSVDRACDAVVMPRPEVVFDFGGYGKGYALELARRCVAGTEVASALLSFGNSSVCAVGGHPSGRPWQVGIEHPYLRGQTLKIVDLQDSSLSSSGNTARNRGHIRSTRTGEPVLFDRVVSVTGPLPLECEVLSTALFAADGPQRSHILRNFPQVRAFAMDFGNGDGTATEYVAG